MKVGTRVVFKQNHTLKGIISDNYITGDIQVNIIEGVLNVVNPATIIVASDSVVIDKQFYRDSKLNQLGIK